MAIINRKEYYLKIPIVILYLLPFIISYFKNEVISFSKIYYFGLTIAVLSLFDLKNEVVNNWIFALTILIFLISSVMILMYFGVF